MASATRVICDSAELTDGGKGVRFSVEYRGRKEPAFIVRYDGTVHAYINNCAHVPVELDWPEGEFFDHSGLYLICSVHGASYEPDTGYCFMGPCKGENLITLQVEERDGKVYVTENVTENGNHDG